MWLESAGISQFQGICSPARAWGLACRRLAREKMIHLEIS
jgi:hypothetical protein